MNMFLWGGAAAGIVSINTPATIAGDYNSGSAQFGQRDYNVSGNLVIVDDGSADTSTLGCNTFINSIWH